MKKNFFYMLVLIIVSACNSPEQKNEKKEAQTKPNIILIVADDLGFSDIGPFGGDIQTPVLDKFAKESMLFSSFHVLPTCSPTRSSLLTGYDNHITGLGTMSEMIYPALEGLPGYSGHLNEQLVTLPEILKQNEYHTYMAGKWHLGDKEGQTPDVRGFEESFVLLQGGGSHYADQKSLSPLEGLDYRVNGKKVAKLPDDFYSTKNYTDTLINFIEKHKADHKPFFMYAAYTAPHDPLHAPKEYVEKYKGKFDMGWDSLRSLRLNNLKALGIVSKDVNGFAPSGVPKWESLNAEQKKVYARTMEVYAAMVDYLDMSIGRLLNYLKQEGMYDNTMILFLSDNGANGAPVTAYPGNADGKYISTFDNTLENRGLPGSLIDMGPGWAQASSSPSRLFKAFTAEGGIRAPLIIKMPSSGTKHEGEWNKSFVHVSDIMPTVLALAGANYPQETKGTPVKPLGKSFLPLLNGKVTELDVVRGMGWELFEGKAYIKGDWKILRLGKPFGNGTWQLYNLEKDPGEMTDLSQQFPGKRDSLISDWMQYAKENGVIDHKGYYDLLL
ncbi:MAG: arylsulfatase, partial [Bacteroidia bacterium]|nr:arylsulfatase [Bacteroidia bacterium]